MNVKAHLELNLASGVMDNKTGCCRKSISNRRTSENVGLLLNGAGEVVTTETETQFKHSLI